MKLFRKITDDSKQSVKKNINRILSCLVILCFLVFTYVAWSDPITGASVAGAWGGAERDIFPASAVVTTTVSYSEKSTSCKPVIYIYCDAQHCSELCQEKH